jgi:23S rRNA G2445 N2-methylase RlmL
VAETFPLLVTCPREFPPVLRKEVEALGYTVTQELPAGVELEGSLHDCLRLNLWLRTAHRVLIRLGTWQARTADQMYEAVHSVSWEDWIPADGYVSIISSVSTPSIDNDMYANMRCKDAVVDRIRDKKGIRPNSGSSTDRSVVFLYWHDDDLMIYVDTSGQPLSDRGYRVHPAKAPMRETLAAAVVLSTKWSPEFPFVNPMCGSGTLAIEAAMIAQNIAPGAHRDNFGFLHLLPFDARTWTQMRNATFDAELQAPPAPILASDIDGRVVLQAKDNARRAGVRIDFQTTDFMNVQVPLSEGITESSEHTPVVIFNPEYGLRLGDEYDLKETYRSIGDFMKQHCKGYTGYVFTGNMSLAKEIGLRSKRRIPFWSADIECRLLEFELYEGSRKKQQSSDD